MAAMPLDEKMRLVFGPRKPPPAAAQSPWDTIESGVPNVYLLRRRNFEKYFDGPSSQKRPGHWPEAWSSKDVVWDSVGTLWAESHHTCNDYFHMGDQLEAAESGAEPADEEKAPPNAEVNEEVSYYENERKKGIILEHVQRVKHDLPWDYLVVYFDQTGFFDGVCTVSFRTPKPCKKEPDESDHHNNGFHSYLAIGSLATEKSLSEEENEKVTGSMVQAVKNLRDMISKDLADHGEESAWCKKGFAPATSFLICIAFEAQAQSYFRLSNNNTTTVDLDTRDDREAYEKDFMSFWKEKIGFEEASTDDTFRVLRKYKTPFDEGCASEDDQSIMKKRKSLAAVENAQEEENDSDSNSSCSIITQTIIDEYDHDAANNEKLNTILGDFRSKIKLLVIR
jgi:hypothetical protein